MIPSEIRVHAAANNRKINSVHTAANNNNNIVHPRNQTIISSSISLLPLYSHKRSQTTDEDIHFRIMLLTHLHIIGATSLGISILTLLSHHYQQYDLHHHQQSILDSQGSNSAGPTPN